jgi:hypothetical protein
MSPKTLLLASAAVALALVGCSGSDESTDTSSDELNDRADRGVSQPADGVSGTAEIVTQQGGDHREGVERFGDVPPQTQSEF